MPDQKTWAYSLPIALILLSPFDLLASLGMDVYLPIVPRMTEVLATTPGVIQLTLSLYLLILGLGQLVFGPASDRLGRRPVLLAGATLFSTMSLALACTTSATAFVAFRVAQAAGASAALVAIFASASDVYRPNRQGVAIFSWLGSIRSLVPMLGPIVGAGVNSVFGWRGVFTLLAFSGALASVQAFLWWPETRPIAHRNVQFAHVREILTSSPFLVHTFAYSTTMGAFFIYFSIAPRILIGQVGLSPPQFSLVFSSTALVMIATTRFTPRAFAHWGERGCLTRGMIVLLTAGVLLALGQVFSYPSVWAFIMPVWLVAIGIAIVNPVTAIGALRPFPHAAGTARAIYSCLESLAVSVIGTVLLLLLPANTAWPLSAFCTVLSLVTMSLVSRLGRPD
jgi:MFS transporter, DHA1 family, chloramphenicol/florfenicol resistance protein